MASIYRKEVSQGKKEREDAHLSLICKDRICFLGVKILEDHILKMSLHQLLNLFDVNAWERRVLASKKSQSNALTGLNEPFGYQVSRLCNGHVVVRQQLNDNFR